ncbi:MAG TPA: RNA polymerase sigma-70 factor [Chitinophagaceae bacterium]|nr:RNA polymerase sigma-70 factor [Chitinophagaceae bacterium]
MHDHSTNSLKVILLKVAEGNENAFRQLFKIYYNQLCGFIMRITESELLTQEIAQDVFMKIWINRSSLANLDCFKAYLLVVARNHTFNCLKQIAREKIRKKEWVNTVLHHAVSNAGETDSIDTGQLIDEAVELLPPQQKKVYTLSRRDGIRQEQIARELNISLETVKKHMVLALRFLKNHLRTYIGLFTLLMTGFFQE